MMGFLILSPTTHTLLFYPTISAWARSREQLCVTLVTDTTSDKQYYRMIRAERTRFSSTEWNGNTGLHRTKKINAIICFLKKKNAIIIPVALNLGVYVPLGKHWSFHSLKNTGGGEGEKPSWKINWEMLQAKELISVSASLSVPCSILCVFLWTFWHLEAFGSSLNSTHDPVLGNLYSQQ